MASFPLVRFGDDRLVYFTRYVNAKPISRRTASQTNFTLSNRMEKVIFYSYDLLTLVKDYAFPQVHHELVNLVEHLQGGGKCEAWRDSGLVLYAAFVASTLSSERSAMTFTRAVPAFYRKRLHNIELFLGEAAANRPRLSEKFGRYFLNMEHTGENQILQSVNYADSSWTKSGVTVLSNPVSEGIFAPNGLIPQRLTGTANGDFVSHLSVDNIATNDIVGGFYLRAKNAPVLMKVSLIQSGGGVLAETGTLTVGQYWQNYFVRYNNGGNITAQVELRLTFLEAGVVYGWNAQAEYGVGCPTSPIINAASQVDRTIDKGFFTIPDNSVIDMLKEGSVSLKFAIDSNELDFFQTAQNRVLVALTDENDNLVVRIKLESGASPTLKAEVYDTSNNLIILHAQLLDLAPFNTLADQINQVSFAWKSSGVSTMYINGIERTPVVQESGFIRAIKRVYIGSSPIGGVSNSSFNGYIGDFELRRDYLTPFEMLERFYCDDILGWERNYYPGMILGDEEFTSQEIPPSSLHRFELQLREVNPLGSAIYPEFPF